jgi:hypothetical protein
LRRFYPKRTLNWVSVLGFLCIALVLMSGVVQAAHFHASRQPDHDCALCLAIHHVASIAPVIQLSFSIGFLGRSVTMRRITFPKRTAFFRLASRPPPSLLPFSA